jgi:hypothetical protein
MNLDIISFASPFHCCHYAESYCEGKRESERKTEKFTFCESYPQHDERQKER